jgi:hypothetical protein
MSKDKPAIKDANAQLQDWIVKGVKASEQARQAEGWLKAARPYILHWAEEVGEIRNLSEKTEALNDFFRNGVAVLSDDDRAGFKDALVQALDIKSTQWTDRLRAMNGKKKKGEKDEDNGEPIPTTGGWMFDHFIGLEYDQELDQTFMAVRFPDGHVEDRLERVEINKRKVVPIPPNRLIKLRILLLPSQMTELKSEEDLLFATKAHNWKYFDCASDETLEHLLMIYPFFTYMASQFRTVPYLRALGDYGTGKTRMLETIGPLCYQAIMTNAGSSASALFRVLDRYPASTLVLDEADFKDSSEASMIGKILNGGNRKGTAILKSEKDAMGNFDPEGYMVFGPKIIGMRKQFDDPATESRCITKEMMPIQPHPRISPELPPLMVYEAACLKIRNALFTYMMHNIQKDCDVDFSGIDPAIDERTKQIVVSLLTVMKSDQGKKLVLEFMRMITEERKGDRYGMYTARVLEGLLMAWGWGPVSDRPEDAERVYLKDIAMATNMTVDEQNRRMGEDDEEEEIKGKDGFKKPRKAKSRKITDIFKKYLNIKTVRATDGLPEYKGTSFVNMAMEMERVRGLCERWGVAWRERGSLVNGEVSDDEKWMKKPVIKMISFNDEGSPGIKKDREDWYGQNELPKSEGE